MKKFKARIVKDETDAWIVFPFDARKEFQQEKGILYVKGTINNIDFRSAIQIHANDEEVLMLDSKLQETLLCEVEQEVEVKLDKESLRDPKNYEEITFLNSGMEVFEALTTRRSIRKYKKQRVEDEKVQQMLAAAMYSPSAHNMQPWHFVVTRNSKVKQQISDQGKHSKMMHDADVCILVCGDKNLQAVPELLYADLGALTQTLLLAGHALGLGLVWCGANIDKNQMAFLKQIFDLKDKLEPFALIACGYPDEVYEKPLRYQPNRIHVDTKE
ncbi:MAG: nitroreductase family protein [Breznakia sp.]